IGGSPEPLAQLRVVEDPGQPRQDRDVLVGRRRQADDEPRRLVAPGDAGRELDHRETGPADCVLGVVRPVRQGDPVAEIGRDDRLPGVHRLDVGRGHEALGDEDAADLLDRVVLRGRDPADLDGRPGQHIRGHAVPASSEMDSPAWRRRTRRSLAGLLRKLRNVRTTACGAADRARAASPSWATTTSVSLGIWLTGEWMTRTSSPASLIRFLSWLAPMRLDPIPASQAKTTL